MLLSVLLKALPIEVVPRKGSGSFPNPPKLTCVELPDGCSFEPGFIFIIYMILGFEDCSSSPLLYTLAIKVKQ